MAPDLQTMLSDCVSVPELAEAMGVDRSNIYDRLTNGRLPAVKAGNNWLIRKPDAIDHFKEDAMRHRSLASQYEMGIHLLEAA